MSTPRVGATHRLARSVKHALLLALTVLLFFALASGAAAQDTLAQSQEERQEEIVRPAPRPIGSPTELHLIKAGSSTTDLRFLPKTKPEKFERPEVEDPEPNPVELPGGPAPSANASIGSVPQVNAAAPAPLASFNGLDFATWGSGHPPDTVGDVGPTYYIQAINASIGIYSKSGGAPVAAFTFNTFMSQGAFGNLCDTNNFGDPVILYDTFENRWVITDFAFQIDGSGNVVNPPGAFQCFAVSKTGDPVSGGWNFYSIHIANGLGDYPKFGIWPDGIYMSANIFGYPAGSSFQNSRVFALNKAQMYAGNPTVQVVTFDAPAGDFTLLPSNARLQTGTPPPGTPNYFVSTWQFTNALGVYKFHVDWTRISNSTLTGPDTPLAATSWPNAAVANAPSQGGNLLDVLQIRAMMQNQYTNFGGVESLWDTHTVRRQDTTGFAAPRWYQVSVTGGTVAANLPQATTWDPDGANVINRFIPSLALDRAGDMALGYSTSSSTTKPAIKYAGRLAGDPVNTFSQTEQLLFQGAGTQTGNCGGSSCIRWGDYSGMSLDPDGCTFWLTNEYYAVDGLNHQTRIGSFSFPSCTPAGTGGTLSGTVTATVGGAPISGATVTLGSRMTTTDGTGFYSFTSLPAGTYPSETASAPGYNSSTVTNVVVTDGNTTTQNFSLSAAPTSACLVDTTQADFQTGVATNVDLTTSPGDVILLNAPALDQANTAGTTTGTSFGTTSWGGQTFIPAVTGQLVKVDVQLFCSGCTGTTPNLTLSIRNTSGGLPTGADLATATISGFSSGTASYYTASFGSPPTLTSGTQYALILRPVAAPSVGGYFWIRSSPSTYANGQRVISTDNGATWTADATRDFNFRTYMQTGFAASGNLVSSLKDSNPSPGFTTSWTTLSWTATVPASTSVQFQVAASNSATGPFNFVGPDGTAATFFTTSGASLSQFNGNRYLEYKAYLSTSNSAVTPTLSDVTICYNVVSLPDLSITKTDGVATAVPGGSVVYTITATNTSAAIAATGATVADTFPALLTCTWTCAGTGGGTCTAAGSGNINDTVNLPASASVTYTATCAVAASATGTLSNTATVTIAGDPNAANNSATDTDTLTPQANLGITKTDGVTTATPGNSVTYTITASNAGPSNAPSSSVTDTFPASLTCTWTCAGAGGGTCTAAGSGNIGDSVNLPVGGSVTYTASCNVSSAATGTLSNTATVTAAGGVTDPTPGNNSATDSDTLAGSADLSITKTDGVTTATAGGSVTYTITASNAGPSNATGATVADTFPASLTCTWTCAGAGGGTCTASGSGNINGTVNLPSGGSVTYTASCTISAAATGSLSNTATVTAPAGVTDPTPGNNSATDTDALGASADLSITKTDGVTTAAPGGSVTYTITASNAGPSNATGATVVDSFPASLTCTWTCAGAGGGTCTASGSGNLNDTVNLPSGGSVTYTASCMVSAAATGTLSNTATVTAPASVTDTNPGNNSATDSDTLAASADLAITKTDGVTSVTAGGSVTYTITASNAGPSNATGATVADTFPASLTCTWTCAGASGGTCTASGSGNINGTVNLPSGGSVTFTASCTLSNAATGTLSNTATVTAPAGVTDPTPGNNSATDSDTITAAPGATVSGTKTAAGTFTVGSTITYTVTLTNSGPGAQGDNPGNELTDVLPPTLALVSAMATSGTAVATVGTNTVTWNGAIASGGTVTITITATILPAAAGQTVSNQGTIAYDADGNGTNESTAQTDDPGAVGTANPTSIVVGGGTPVPAVPTLSTLGLALLALLLGGLAFAILRRRRRSV
jgi:uncharacterized repeat protein (TIGR01451 family)